KAPPAPRFRAADVHASWREDVRCRDEVAPPAVLSETLAQLHHRRVRHDGWLLAPPEQLGQQRVRLEHPAVERRASALQQAQLAERIDVRVAVAWIELRQLVHLPLLSNQREERERVAV